MHNFIVDILTMNDLVYKPVQYWKKDLMLFDEDKTALLQAKWLTDAAGIKNSFQM